MEAELLMTSVCMRRRLRIVEINSSLLPPRVHSILHGAKRDCARMLICFSLLRKTQNYRVAFIMPVKSQKAHHFHLMPSLTVSVCHCFWTAMLRVGEYSMSYSTCSRSIYILLVLYLVLKRYDPILVLLAWKINDILCQCDTNTNHF